MIPPSKISITVIFEQIVSKANSKGPSFLILNVIKSLFISLIVFKLSFDTYRIEKMFNSKTLYLLKTNLTSIP